jgi:hypothetical protein
VLGPRIVAAIPLIAAFESISEELIIKPFFDCNKQTHHVAGTFVDIHPVH